VAPLVLIQTVVCSTAHFEPAAELDLLEVHTQSIQTCAQLWDPEKVLQTTGWHSEKPHKNPKNPDSEGNTTPPLPAGI